MNALTEKSLNVLNFLKGEAGDLTLDDVAAKLGVESKSVNGTLVALQKRGFVERVAAGTTIVNGKAKIINYIKVTDNGFGYDHDTMVALDEEEAAAKKAAKEAEKAAKKAAKEAEAEA